MPVGWGVVAVDPSVIPLGTRLTIPGYGEARRRGHGQRRPGSHHRPLVPDPRAGPRLGPPDGHDHAALELRRTLAKGVRADRSAADAEERQTESLRVLIVDDHDLFRTGLRNLLEEQGVQIVGEAAERRRGGAGSCASSHPTSS